MNKFIVIFIALFIILIIVFFGNVNVETFDNTKDETKDENECPGPIQLTGKEGPQGPPGLPGGIFQKQGPLRNIGNPTLVTDRLAGIGPSSVPYLANMNYTTHQTWTLENNKIQNSYGGCLYGDKSSNLTYMMDCNNKGIGGLEWQFDNLGRLKLKSEPSKCLTPVYEGTFNEADKKLGLISTTDKQKINKYDKFMQLKLNDCDNTQNQKWSWY